MGKKSFQKRDEPFLGLDVPDRQIEIRRRGHRTEGPSDGEEPMDNIQHKVDILVIVARRIRSMRSAAIVKRAEVHTTESMCAAGRKPIGKGQKQEGAALKKKRR